MTRVAAREYAMQLVFAMFENPAHGDDFLTEMLGERFVSLAEEDELFRADIDPESREYLLRLVAGTSEHGAELDSYIEKYAKGWEFSRISAVALAAMRVAMYETMYMRDVIPPRASINAVIDLVKKYDSDETAKFVNGVLGTFSRAELGDNE
ncbi:MAG: transcription antitermination factor NusB [Oscillospiraceae bacterium]|jgi:N utilization substance protein B|nr:transcription antitermination factor NusB [Oscillospiraceae bacterium]